MRSLYAIGCADWKHIMMKPSASSMNRRIVYGVFTFPARRTDFDAVTLPFTKNCSQSWTHPAGRTCLSRAKIGTCKIARKRRRFLAALCEHRCLWLKSLLLSRTAAREEPVFMRPCINFFFAALTVFLPVLY